MKISNRTGIAGRDLLTVRRKGERVTVHLGSNSRALATVSPDEVYPTLYRVKLPGGINHRSGQQIARSRCQRSRLPWPTSTHSNAKKPL